MSPPVPTTSADSPVPPGTSESTRRAMELGVVNQIYPRSSRDDPRRAWYIWRDPAADGGPPNNWTRHFAGGRDGCRAPIPWDETPAHGWATADPWLPWPDGTDTHNARAQRDWPRSTLHLYRRLLAERRASPALARGDQTLLDLPDHVLGYRRRSDDERLVLVNFAGSAAELELPGAWTVAVASHRDREDAPFDGRLAADTAVVLRPR